MANRVLTDSEWNDFGEAVTQAGGGVRARYSGRGMCGEACIGAVLHGIGDLLGLGMQLAPFDLPIDAGTVCTDSMGHGIIVYFPSIQAPEGARDGNG